MPTEIADNIEVLSWGENITLSNIEPFRHSMNQLINSKKECLVLDLTDTQYINSAGLGVIADGVIHSRKEHKELVIAGVHDSVKEIFIIVKFTTFMKIFDSKKEALDFFQEDQEKNTGM